MDLRWSSLDGVQKTGLVTVGVLGGAALIWYWRERSKLRATTTVGSPSVVPGLPATPSSPSPSSPPPDGAGAHVGPRMIPSVRDVSADQNVEMALIPLQQPTDIAHGTSTDPAVRRRVDQILGMQLDALGAPPGPPPHEGRAVAWLRSRGTPLPLGTFAGGDIAGQMLFWAAQKINTLTRARFYPVLA